jgi:hypothetical protein
VAPQATIAQLEAMMDHSDARLSAAARDAASMAIQEAIAKVGPNDPHVQKAQRDYEGAIAAFNAGDYDRATREFSSAFDSALRAK